MSVLPSSLPSAIVDVFSRYIVGWRVAVSLRTDLVLDALEQVILLGPPELQATG